MLADTDYDEDIQNEADDSDKDPHYIPNVHNIEGEYTCK